MFDQIPMLRAGSALVAHASARAEVTARNVANADTPGWRARRVEAFALPSATAAPQATRSGHLGPPADGPVVRQLLATDPNGNGVSVEDEMVQAARARADHELALGAWRGALDVLRTAIGRR